MRRRLLVIDDEAATAKLLADFFSAKGFTVDTAGEGAEALRKMEAAAPDAIILDVMMPGMDGYTFVRELKKRADWRSIPVIVLTAREMMRDLFVEEGVKEYMIKPFEPAELEAVVLKALSQ